MGQQIAFGEFSFDPDTGALSRRGRTVKLHPQPTQLLALLLDRPGHLVSRLVIQKALWTDDATFVDFDIGINSCIRQIRAALGDDANQPRYVETVSKKGYRFVADVSKPREAPPREAGSRIRTRRLAIIIGAVATVLAIAAFLWRPPEPVEPLASGADGRHVVVVLPFDNVNQDASLEWLQVGMAELLVSGLAQRADLSVVPMGDVYDLIELSDRMTTTERVERALEHLRSAVEVLPATHRNAGHSHNLASQIFIELRHWDAALEAAQRAQHAGRGNEPEWEGLFWAAVASARKGNPDEALRLAARLQERTKDIPSPKEVRRHHWLLGQIALDDGRPLEAVEHLEAASALLAQHGNRLTVNAEGHQGPPHHAPIWFALGSAYLQRGDEERARAEFQKIVDGPGERASWPIVYARSLYSLAEQAQRVGDTAAAEKYYREFYEFWKEGDLDRDRIELARGKLRG